MKKVSIKDVAKEAGVSISSVSNALNPNSNRVSKERREHILKVVEDLGYIPDKRAQALSSANVKRIGLFIKNSGSFEVDNSINSEIIYYLNKVAQDKQVEMINIFSVNDNKGSYETILKNINSYGLTHLIVFGLDFDNKYDEMIEKINIRKIYIDMPIKSELSTFVSIDNYCAQKQLISKLYESYKFKKMTYISGDLNSYVGLERQRATRSFCKKRNIELREFEGDFSHETGYNVLAPQTISEDEVIACGCDITAIGVVEALKERNMSNIVLGFDGLSVMKFIHENFMSVKQRYDLMAEVIIEMIENENYEAKVVPYEITERKS